jgi:nitroreductase
MKKILKIILGPKNFEKLRVFLNRKILKYYYKKNFLEDYNLFIEQSTVFNKDNYNKIETHIILNYHSIEKGFLHDNLRLGFAKAKIIETIQLLKNNLVKDSLNNSQIRAAAMCLVKYYELHQEKKYDLSSYFSEKEYHFFKTFALEDKKPVIEKSADSYFEKVQSNFYDFSYSRNSIRHFSGELIPEETMLQVINLARNAPSVCNRQGSKVYLVQNIEKVKKLLEVQGGLAGFMDNINQVLVLTVNRNFYYAIGERNQMFIDGGAFLMNLLYSLHYNKIAACPAHWAYEHKKDDSVRDIIGMTESEKIMCLIAIGKPKEKFTVTLSQRRLETELLSIVN